jgi:hypothetical protein
VYSQKIRFQKNNKKVELYDVTIFQTPRIGEKRGYRPVYRLHVKGKNHGDVLANVFAKLNVADTTPPDYRARYISTGDIVLIDEGIKGKMYYKLCIGGWEKIHRMYVC